MTEEHHRQLLRIAALELRREEEARDAFFNAPSGQPTSQCITVKQIKKNRLDTSKWSKEAQEHINVCSSCRLFIKLVK